VEHHSLVYHGNTNPLFLPRRNLHGFAAFDLCKLGEIAVNSAILERLADGPSRASYYVDRARELRALADTMTTPEARLLLLSTAAEYERLAASLRKERKSRD
jgi:hypothetical protein